MNASRILLGFFSLSLLLPAGRALAADAAAQTPVLEEGDRPAKKPAKKKKKGYDYDRSKYKSKFDDTGATTYRFNEKGEPVDGEKKKSTPKKKKKSEPPEVDSLKPAVCGDEGSCLEKKSDADAL